MVRAGCWWPDELIFEPRRGSSSYPPDRHQARDFHAFAFGRLMCAFRSDRSVRLDLFTDLYWCHQFNSFFSTCCQAKAAIAGLPQAGKTDTAKAYRSLIAVGSVLGGWRIFFYFCFANPYHVCSTFSHRFRYLLLLAFLRPPPHTHAILFRTTLPPPGGTLARKGSACFPRAFHWV